MRAKNEPADVSSIVMAPGAAMSTRVVSMVSAAQGAGSHEASLSTKPWREEIIRLLKDSLITDLVSLLCFKNLAAGGLIAQPGGEAFQAHENQELAHAIRLAHYIVALGGDLEYAPQTLIQLTQATPERHPDLQSVVEANLTAELMAILSYSRINLLIDGQDVATRRLLLEILSDEKKHAEELKGWLVN